MTYDQAPEAMTDEPSFAQLKQIIDTLDRCHHRDSKAEFLRVWIRDWTQHKTERLRAQLAGQAHDIADALRGHVKTLKLSGRNDALIEDMERAAVALTPQPAGQAGGEPVGTVHGHANAYHRSELTVTLDKFVKPGTKLYTAPQQQAGGEVVAVPNECPHVIWFDDADMQPIVFAGAGAKAAAEATFKAISGSWNASLFVRIEGNSQDDPFPSATIAATPAPEPKAEPVGNKDVAVRVPEGFALVPVEPTPEMLRAGHGSISCVGSCGEASPPEVSDFCDVWTAMLAARPLPNPPKGEA